MTIDVIYMKPWIISVDMTYVKCQLYYMEYVYESGKASETKGIRYQCCVTHWYVIIIHVSYGLKGMVIGSLPKYLHTDGWTTCYAGSTFMGHLWDPRYPYIGICYTC